MLRTERQSARMSKIKNGGLDQHGTGGPSNSSNLEELALKGSNIRTYLSLSVAVITVFSLSLSSSSSSS